MKIQVSNEKKRSLLLLTGLFFTFVTIIALSLLALMPHRPREFESVSSPSGKRILIPTINLSKEDMTKYLCVRIEIQDIATGETIFETQTGASDRMRWSVQWLNERYVQLKSSDIGDICWEEGPDKIWMAAKCPE